VTDGTVTTTKGATKPIHIRLVYEGGKWKVVDVRYGGVDLVTVRVLLTVPPKEELERLVRETLLGFRQSVQDKDFTAIHGKVSEGLKKATTPEKLLEAFREFVDKKLDIAPNNNVQPQYERPAVLNDNGVLIVSGHTPTPLFLARFDLNYVKEGGDWKLSFISVKTEKRADNPAPQK